MTLSINLISIPLSLCLLGCMKSAPVANPGAAAKNATVQDDWKTVTGNNGKVSLTVPSDWVELDPTAEQVQSFAKGAGQLNPKLGVSQDQVKQIVADKAIQLFVFAPIDAETLFRPNVNILLVDNDSHETLDELDAELSKDLKKIGTIIGKGRPKIGGKDALETEVKASAGPKGLVVEDIFVLPRGTSVYQMTFSIPQRIFPQMKPNIDRIAGSFEAK